MILNLEIGLSESKMIRIKIIVEPKNAIRLSRNSAAKSGQIFRPVRRKKRVGGTGHPNF
jgi:hypothetical protein